MLLHIVFKAACQIHNCLHIFFLLKGQTNHNVQAEMTNPGRQPHIHSIKEMFFFNPLVDDGAHAGTARLRRHSQRLESAFGQGIHQFLRHRIRTEGSHRHGKTFAQNILAKLVYLRIIRDCRAHQTDTLFILQSLFDLPCHHRQRAIARTAETVACHAETAMTATAARRFNQIKVKLRIFRTHHRMGRVHIQILHPLTADFCRRIFHRGNRLQAAIFSIAVFVKGWHIDTGHLRQAPQHFLTGYAFIARLIEHIHQRRHNDLTFANNKGIDHRRQRFRIEGCTGAPRNNQRVHIAALLSAHLDLAKLQHLDDVKVIHFKGQDKGNHRKLLQRQLIFHAHERRARIFITLNALALRQEYPLTSCIAALIEQVIDDVQP